MYILASNPLISHILETSDVSSLSGGTIHALSVQANLVQDGRGLESGSHRPSSH